MFLFYFSDSSTFRAQIRACPGKTGTIRPTATVTSSKNRPQSSPPEPSPKPWSSFSSSRSGRSAKKGRRWKTPKKRRTEADFWGTSTSTSLPTTTTPTLRQRPPSKTTKTVVGCRSRKTSEGWRWRRRRQTTPPTTWTSFDLRTTSSNPSASTTSRRKRRWRCSRSAGRRRLWWPTSFERFATSASFSSSPWATASGNEPWPASRRPTSWRTFRLCTAAASTSRWTWRSWRSASSEIPASLPEFCQISTFWKKVWRPNCLRPRTWVRCCSKLKSDLVEKNEVLSFSFKWRFRKKIVCDNGLLLTFAYLALFLPNLVAPINGLLFML